MHAHFLVFRHPFQNLRTPTCVLAMASRCHDHVEGSVLSPELDPCKLYSLREVFGLVEKDLLIETLCLSGEYSAAVYDWKELIDALQSNSKHARLWPLRRILRFAQVLLELSKSLPRPSARRLRAKRGAAESRRYLLGEALVLSEQMCRDQAVTRVSLDENKLDQDVSQLEDLSLMVANTTTLRRLDLAFNRLSNIETLATALNKSNRTLTTLNLGFNRYALEPSRHCRLAAGLATPAQRLSLSL